MRMTGAMPHLDKRQVLSLFFDNSSPHPAPYNLYLTSFLSADCLDSKDNIRLKRMHRAMHQSGGRKYVYLCRHISHLKILMVVPSLWGMYELRSVLPFYSIFFEDFMWRRLSWNGLIADADWLRRWNSRTVRGNGLSLLASHGSFDENSPELAPLAHLNSVSGRHLKRQPFLE